MSSYTHPASETIKITWFRARETKVNSPVQKCHRFTFAEYRTAQG